MQRALDEKRAEIIAFIGIDGSGKSTLVGKVADWIAASGQNATLRKTSSGRSQLDKLSQRLGSRDLAGVVGDEASLMMQVGIVWKNLRDARGLVRTPKTFAVLDRYTWCHMAMTRMYAPAREPFVRELFAKFRAPDLTFFIDVPPAAAFARLEARGDNPNTLDFLSAFDAAYRTLPEFASFVRIDGTLAPGEVLAATCAELAARYSVLGVPRLEAAA